MMFKFSLSRLLRHWKLNLPVLLGLTLASALLMCIPGYADITAHLSLRQSFQDQTPVSRNIEVTADSSVMTARLNAYIMEAFGDLITSRLAVQKIEFQSSPSAPIIAIDPGDHINPNGLIAWSFDRTDGLLRTVEGSFPDFSRPYTREEIQRAMTQLPVIQAAVSKEVANRVNLHLGDVLVEAGGYKFQIVGIIEQVDPHSDIWWGDASPFNVTFLPGTNEDTIIVPVIIDPQAIQEYFLGYSRVWRYLVDNSLITPETNEMWEEKLLSLKTLLQKNHAQIISDIPGLLLTFRNNLATNRMVLLLLGTQSFIFILYTLILIASSVLERTQGEISTMVGRGASSWQLIRMHAFETGILAALAGFVLAPIVSSLFFNIWSLVTGTSYHPELSVESLLYAAAGATLGWLCLVLGMIPMIRRSILEWRYKLSRPEAPSRWSKIYLDAFLVVLGGIVFWQLSTSGSFVYSRLREAPQADPLLLLSPTILLIAISLVLLRIFPYILNGFAWMARSLRGIVLPIGLSRIARNPGRYNQIVIMVGAAFGLMIFMTTYDISLTTNQRALAHYQSGADLRIATGNLDITELEQHPGVISASQAIRMRLSTNTGNQLTLLALDSKSFPEVAFYPSGMTNLSMEAITRVLSSDTAQSQSSTIADPNQANIPAIPAVYSLSALPANKGIGDTMQVLIQGFPVNLIVRGIIADFPTVSNAYLLVDIATLQSVIDLNSPVFHNMQETWLGTDPSVHRALVAELSQETTILSNAQAELQNYQNNAFTEGARRAFTLNTAILAVLSIAGFVLLNYFSAQQRLYEFGILRANGMSVWQVIILLICEGVLVMFSGLVVGAGIGFGLVHSMKVFLNTALAKAFPGAVVYEIILDWSRIRGLTSILIFAYFLATLLFIIILVKSGVHRVIKIGEE